MSDRITFNCTECGHGVVIDKSKPPKDDDILSCFGCGREFGAFKIVKDAMIKAGKAELEKLAAEHLKDAPSWLKVEVKVS